jgi:hypothetical protein
MLPIGLELTDSMTLGEFAVGAGTALLAGFTGWLGFEARASAKAAKEAVEASEEPFVIATPTDNPDAITLRGKELSEPVGWRPPLEIHRVRDRDGTHFVRLKLWNIGSGPAIVQQVALQRDRDFLDDLDGFKPIGAGHAADIEITSPAWPRSSAAATLTIDYTRASGLAYRTSQAVVVEGPIVLSTTYERSRRGR